MTMLLVFAGAAFVLFLLARRWGQLNSHDLGTMSENWLAEHNAQNS
ncbi:MAG TPA: hypothetical protein VFZ31_06445 [Vicinamibacterales bacterium]